MAMKDTVYRRIEFGRRRRVAVEGQELFLGASEDVILSKLEWARASRSAVQLADVRNDGLLDVFDSADAGRGLDPRTILRFKAAACARRPGSPAPGRSPRRGATAMAPASRGRWRRSVQSSLPVDERGPSMRPSRRAAGDCDRAARGR